MNQILEVIGTQPSIEGQVCEELLVEEYWHDGNLIEPSNVVHLRFTGVWHRLTIDCGTVFWRVSQETPLPYAMLELQAEVRIVDLGAYCYNVRGVRLDRIETTVIKGGSEVAFHFSGNTTVRFRNVDDVTTHAA